MEFGWLKRLMPRGLYGRAALILLVPIVSLQLVVSAAILQRYFEGVSRQMSVALALDINLIVSRLEAEGDAGAIASALSIEIVPDAETRAEDRRVFYDLTGLEVIRVLRRDVPGFQSIDLRTDWRRPTVYVALEDQAVALVIPRSRMSASNPHQLLVLMVFTGALMTYVAYLFLRNQLRPIKRLALASEAFGKGRIRDYSPSGAKEVRSAGRAFLEMRSRIVNMLEQRTKMLSSVSHDLRTPLTRMRLALSMMEPNQDVKDLTRDVEEMEGLLTTFLDFARGEALDDPEPTDPLALARVLVEDLERGGGNVGLVVADEAAAASEAMLRPQAVRRCLGNLMSNALRYGSRAVLTVSVIDRAVRYSVEDDGPGIPEERREEALKPFARLDAARNQNRGSGVGLGLAIARDIAQRHGGSLSLGESTTLGGLRVDLVLPR